MPSDAAERITQYFRVKARQLAALAELPICEHPSLVGGHREEIHRVYLSEVLPRRYAVSRGMVYGIGHRSREADIVIWDAQNYPALPMLDHAFFFAESVRAVLESKSVWSAAAFADVKAKCGSVRAIVPVSQPNLIDAVSALEQDVYSLRAGVDHHGALLVKPHIGTAALFFRGGQDLGLPTEGDPELAMVDDNWPDAMLLLGSGRVVLKQYDADEQGVGGTGRLELYEAGENALLVFTTALLTLVMARSSALESPIDLAMYTRGFAAADPSTTVRFPLTRPLPQRVPLWVRE